MPGDKNKKGIRNIFRDNEFIDKNKPLTFWERLYFIEIIKGLAVTIRHFLHNLFNYSDLPTIDYPEKKRKIPLTFRGRHRLTKKPDGTPRCVACYLCATACPAKCIYIEAGEYKDGNPIEKYPVRYEIDMLRCVFCGFCVEACPCDAIRMDTGEYDLADYSREKLIFDKETLMGNYPPVINRGDVFNPFGSSADATSGKSGGETKEYKINKVDDAHVN
ncbi:MAG TPA: NADH-quinone oxidoreductase subunit I [Candidatus Wallbacteria bacterium]|mgnify:FL=1|nr:NADH-quinone oxidoreductase subunit I [Candidatus Wallbacteria bacterium]